MPRRIALPLLAAISLAAALNAQTGQQAADLVITGGTVITVDGGHTISAL